MKLIIAIVSRDDAGPVTRALTRAGFGSTRLATTGGFLRAENGTVLVGVDEERVQDAVEVIKAEAHARQQTVPAGLGLGYDYYPTAPVEVTVGGATIFVVDIERFERV